MIKTLTLISFYILLTGCSISNSLVYNGNEEKTPSMKIKILDQTSLAYKTKDNIPFSEISDLSYDKKSQKLYMIGDKGYFYTFSANFSNKIDRLDYLGGYKIREKKSHSSYDSEGLTQDNRGQLYISFEGVPRISSISNSGYINKNLKLTKHIKNSKNYRSSNKMFEALTWHSKYGLLTASEYPTRNKKIKQQSIYSLNGKTWDFMAEPHENSAVTAIETMDDGNILILERAYAGLSKPFVITLKKLYLNKCDKNHQCKTEVLASMNSYDGWGINNYEGLTKIGKNRYLMVSDNNNKQLLRTVLVYFEVKK
jgi:hypothetical protein